MVAVAATMSRDVRCRPLVEEPRVVEPLLQLVPAVERLVHDEEPHGVGHREELGRRRVVRRPERVDAHRLEHLESLLQSAGVHRASEGSQVVVIARAVELEALPVERESRVRVEGEIRIPNGVVYVSTTVPLTETVVMTEYIVGEESDQILGLVTVSVCVTSLADPAATDTGVAEPWATWPPDASRIELATVTDWADAPSFWTVVVTLTVALEAVMAGVVTRVPV